MSLLIATTCLVFTGCSADMKIVEEDATEKLQDSKLSPYIEKASYKEGGKTENRISVNININVDERFSDLETMEKYEVMQDAVTKLGGTLSLIKCGNDNYCVYDNLHITHGDDKYTMDVFYKELVINDDKKYTESDYNSDMNQINKKDTPVTTNSDTVSSTPKGQYASNGISYTVIFDFMKQQYNRLTNNDENYIPEVHDPQVAEIAARQFGITAKEAGYIYEKVQMDTFN
ncbi:hypothetical protein [Bacillus paramobilis]|uniref:hypothetical protein n=1 Tax=Bacillus paramobilis TaxID=2817477 RepID=UPI003D225EDF